MESKMEIPQGVIIAHDDKIMIRLQKSDIDMRPEWWKAMVPDEEITGWFHPPTKESRPKEWECSPEDYMGGWRPKRVRRRRIIDSMGREKGWVIVQDNRVDLVMSNLMANIEGTRYREIVDGVIGAVLAGIIDYRPHGEPSTRSMVESKRIMAKKYGAIAEYEWNLFFMDDDMGKMLLEELRPHSQPEAEEAMKAKGEEWDTVYLSGFGSKGSIKAKAYRSEQGKVKIEITLRKDFFKANGMRRVSSEWGTQPEIQTRIRKTVIRELSKIMRKAPKVKGMLMERMPTRYRLNGSKGGSGIQTDFMGWMLSTDNTLKNVQERLAKVEGEQERMKAEYRRGQELIQERLAILEAERKRT